MGRSRRCLLALALSLAAPGGSLANPASADSSKASAEKPEASAPQPSAPAKPPVAPLPRPRPTKLPAPKADDLHILDQLLDRLRVPDPVNRQLALVELKNVDDSLLPAIQARIEREAERADRARMKRLLLDIRDAARKKIEQRMRAAGEKGDVETPDYLEMVVGHEDTSPEAWTPLVTILALSRMCVHLGTVEAVRVLLTVYVRFEFLRIDTQLQLAKLQDRALAALIEATRHPAVAVSSWARRQLDFLGKAIPGEAVQVSDPTVLADVLRAFGTVKDPDAARVVLSFANSERAQIREAARESVVLFGEVANWQLRDTYENMVGRRPPRDWSWDRTARELFHEFDSMRLAEVYGHYQLGLGALQRGDHAAMRESFDRVLLEDPHFEPRDQLVRGYLSYAEADLEKPDPEVDTALSRVLRLSQEPELQRRAESLLLTRRAARYAEQRLADQSLLARALELDPENEPARSLLAKLKAEPVVERTTFMRVLWPSLLVAAALGAVASILLRRFRGGERDTAHAKVD